MKKLASGWDWGKTLRLVLYVVMAFGVGVGTAVASATTADGVLTLDYGIIGLGGLAYVAIRTGTKWFKVYYAQGLLEKLLVLPLVCILALGCATVRTDATETIVDADGSSYSFSYECKSRAAPFGKIDATVHDLDYTVEDSGRLRVGQAAQGIDNTSQTDAITATGVAIREATSGALGQMLVGQTPSPANTGSAPDIGPLFDQLRILGELIEKIP